MAIVAAIALVQIVPAVMKGYPLARILAQLSVWVIETPLQMAVLSVAFDSAVRRQLGPTRLLLECLLIASLIGAIFTVGLIFFLRVGGIDPGFPTPMSYPVAAAFGAVMGLLLCGVWALAFVYPYSVEQSRLRTLEADRLRLEADQLRTAAEIARLRAQLEPHFLLNTLNAIAGLVTQNPREARRLLGCLGDLLRDSLHDEDEMQPLDHEVAWLQRYANILESRHGSALTFQWEIADETRTLLVPRLLLQPLVENAVQHGAMQRASGGVVTVTTYLDRQVDPNQPMLICVVADNGPGIPLGFIRADAFGLKAVRRRLELKYSNALLSLESSSLGTRSIVALPASRAPVPIALRSTPTVEVA